MNFGRFRLLAQLGAGRDGVAYRAETLADGRAAQVHVLSIADAERWQVLKKRLRLAALVDHPAAVHVLACELEHDPPYLAHEPVAETSWPAQTASRVPLPWREAV